MFDSSETNPFVLLEHHMCDVMDGTTELQESLRALSWALSWAFSWALRWALRWTLGWALS